MIHHQNQQGVLSCVVRVTMIAELSLKPSFSHLFITEHHNFTSSHIFHASLAKHWNTSWIKQMLHWCFIPKGYQSDRKLFLKEKVPIFVTGPQNETVCVQSKPWGGHRICWWTRCWQMWKSALQVRCAASWLATSRLGKVRLRYVLKKLPNGKESQKPHYNKKKLWYDNQRSEGFVLVATGYN